MISETFQKTYISFSYIFIENIQENIQTIQNEFWCFCITGSLFFLSKRINEHTSWSIEKKKTF